jgi:hypothetical protein
MVAILLLLAQVWLQLQPTVADTVQPFPMETQQLLAVQVVVGATQLLLVERVTRLPHLPAKEMRAVLT